MNPEIDKQKDIYTAIIAYLDAAIEDLPKGDTHVSGKAGAQDILFKGDANKWLKLAYGLKARYTMAHIKCSRRQNCCFKHCSGMLQKRSTKRK